jgi:predicted site-specific integrase-resolvase
MTETQPNINPAGRYTIAKTCEILQINRTTLHRHTKKGHIKVYYRKSTSRPFYKGLDILKFWQIAI